MRQTLICGLVYVAGVMFAQVASNPSTHSTGPTEEMDVFVETAAYTSVMLSVPPNGASLLKVYRNGLLMAANIDYVVQVNYGH